MPGDPGNDSILSAVAAFGGIDVSWNYPTTYPEAVAYTKLYRATVPNYDAAIFLLDVAGSFHYDKLDTEIRYYYWIRHISVNGTVGELIGPASAIARPLIKDMIERLTGEIDAGFLATSLKNQIDRIGVIGLALAGEVVSRENGETTLAEAMADVNAGVAQALTFLANEQTSRVSADSVLAESLNLIAVTWNGNLAAIQTALRAEISTVDERVTTVAQSVTQVATQAANQLALVNSNLHAEIVQVDGKVNTLATRVDTVQVGSVNLVENSGMVPGIGGWDQGPLVSRTAAGVPVGAPSDYVYKHQGRDQYNYRYIPVAEGEVFDVSFWAASATPTNATANLYFFYYGEDKNQVINLANVSSIPAGLTGWKQSPAASWSRPGPDVKFVRVVLQIEQANNGGPNTIYFAQPTVVKRSASGLVAMAAVQTESTARQTQYGVLAQNITTVESQAGNNLAQAQQTLQTNINTVNGKVTEIGALWTVKLNVEGLAGGFGVYNNGQTVVAGFDVDNFWIGRTAANKRKPFIINGGIVYIDEAAIYSLVFTKLRDEAGNVMIENGRIKAQYLKVDSASITDLEFTKLRDAGGTFLVQGGRVQAQYLRVNEASMDDLSVSRAKIQDLAVDTLQLAGNSVSATLPVTGSGATISTSLTVPPNNTYKVVLVGFQTGFGGLGVGPGSADLSMNGASTACMCIVSQLDSGGEAGGSTTVYAVPSATVANTLTLGPGTYPLSLTGYGGVSKTLIAFVSKK